MPNFDRTGPTGQGSQTGRGLGKCNPANRPSGSKENLAGIPSIERRRLAKEGTEKRSGVSRGRRKRLRAGTA